MKKNVLLNYSYTDKCIDSIDGEIFLQSLSKLKGFEKQNTDVASEYSQHKKDAVFYCKQLLNTEKYERWKFMMEAKKKDDLADCFLQGVVSRGNYVSPCDPLP